MLVDARLALALLPSSSTTFSIFALQSHIASSIATSVLSAYIVPIRLLPGAVGEPPDAGPCMHVLSPIHPTAAEEYTAIENTSDTSLQAVLKAVGALSVVIAILGGSQPEDQSISQQSSTNFQTSHRSRPVNGAKKICIVREAYSAYLIEGLADARPQPTAQAANTPRALKKPPSESMSSTASPARKIGRQRIPRPKKRHLVRWTDDMDKKLLLTIQQECNKQNIPLPWKEIGVTMGPSITGGAVVQHLSKLRIRMVAQDLPVPPPLKRGGGIKISTGPSLPRRPTKASQPTTARDATVKKSGKPANKKRALADMISDSDDSGEEDFKIESDSDVDYRKPLAKRTRTAAAPKHQSPTKRSDDADSNNDSSEDEADHEADGNDNRVVAAGADFLTLEDDVPTKKSKVVTLKPGKPVIKQESSQEQDSESESDESHRNGDEAAGGSEDQASQAAHALEAISHTNTPDPNYAGNTSNHANAGHPSVSPSSSIGAHTMTNPEYGQLINNGHPAFGGLPTTAGLNIPTFQNPYEAMQYADGHDPRARGQQYHSMPQSDGRYMTYGHDYGQLPNQTFGIAPMSTDAAFSANLPFHVSNDLAPFPYVDHSIPSRARSYSHQGHQASLSAGVIPLNSAGPPTVNQMPISAEADYFQTSSFGPEHHELGMLSDEDLSLDYGGYHQRT